MTIQNYVGLDARIESIVRALMGDVDVDLSDYYRKEEVDALIASGGTGLQINYNDLLNRPIIDGLMQSSLDLNGHFLLYNSQRLYCPAVIENIITFDSDVSIPNMYNKAEVDALIAGGGTPIDAYTKTETDGLLALKANVADVYSKAECDEKFGGGGSIPDPLNVNNLTVSKRLNIQSKDTTDESVKGYIHVAGRNTSDYYLSMGLQYGIIDVYPDRVDYNVNNVRFGTSNIIELNYNKETQRNLLSAEHTLDIQAPSISFNGTLENIYTKTEVDDLIAGGVVSEYIQTRKFIIEAPNVLYGYVLSCEDNNLRLFTSERDLIATFNSNSLNYFTHTDNPFSITREVDGYDKIATTNNALVLSCNVIALEGNESTGRVVLTAKDIIFNGTLENVYTKAEVDALIAGGGGGGGTCRYNGPENDSVHSDAVQTWQLNFEGSDNPAYLNALVFAQLDMQTSTMCMVMNHFSKYIGFTYGSPIAETAGVCIYPEKNELYVSGKIQASNIEAQTGLLVTGPSVFNMRADITDLNINGSNCNVYTKAEVDAKVAGTTSASQTITHEAPYVGEPDEYTVGDPVFASGRVCKFDMMNNEWTTETGATDCICEVKPEGTVGEYMGICVGFNETTKSLIFATHGDYYFNVADSSKYKIGDIILLDGSVLKDDMALTGKVMKMIVGKITGKINKTTVAVLKD